MCCCCGCGLCGCGESKPGASRVLYFLWFLVSSVLAWVLRDYGSPALGLLPWASECSDSANEASCLGKQAVFRISFANLVFFASHALVLIGVRNKDDLRLVLHTSLWPLKLLAWGGITVGFFLIPSDATYTYAQVARVLSGLYLVMQLVVLLDFIYRLNNSLLDREGCIPVLVILTAICYVTGLVAIGFQYHLFAPSPRCGLNIFLVTFTLILGAAASIVSVLPKRSKDAGLFTASAVFLYATFLSFSALNSEPNSAAGQCERYAGTQTNWITVCGFLVTLASVGWSALSAGSQKDAFVMDMAEEMSPGDEEDAGGSGDEELTFLPSVFHLMFSLASAYLAMVLTGWTWATDANSELEADQGAGSLWVKIAAQWVSFILYIWTVIAPIVLPDRDFG